MSSEALKKKDLESLQPSLSKKEEDFQNRNLDTEAIKNSDKEVSYEEEDRDENTEFMQALKAKKLQTILSKTSIYKQSIKESPLKINLEHAESLKISQAKINSLERELDSLRLQHEDIIASCEVLKDRAKQLLAEKEDMKQSKKRAQKNFLDEKKTLMNILSAEKKQAQKLKTENKDLKNRFSEDLKGIRFKEHSLESQMDILKSEMELLKKEKDNKIILLSSKNKKLKFTLEGLRTRNQELQNQIESLKENSRRIVSVLRTTVNNLEGLDYEESPDDAYQDTQESIIKKDNDE